MHKTFLHGISGHAYSRLHYIQYFPQGKDRMELRTAYCLNAFFKRRNPNRLLRTELTRIGTARQIRTVSTPALAAETLGLMADQAPVAFVIEGFLHDCFKCTDSAVDVLGLTFLDRASPSLVSVNEEFLGGLIHFDTLPELRGPDIVSFMAMLRRAGDSWQAIDFMEYCQREHAAA